MTARSATIKIDHLATMEPLTDNQVEFFSLYKEKDVLLLHGCAGTGKTAISIYKALESVLDRGNIYKRVVIVRSAVAAREIGHLPGDLEEKGMVFEAPYVSLCNDLVDRGDGYSRLKEQKHLVFCLSSYLRGITLDNSIIVVDEIQNMNYVELYTIMTRIGIDSKIIFCGDTKQNDINGKSGLDKFVKVLDNMPSACRIEFTIDDIVRSDLVKEFIIAESKI